MTQQFNALIKLQTCNLININVAKHSKDKHQKNRTLGLIAAYIIVVFVLFLYVGAFSFGLVKLGFSTIIPSYLVAITSIIIFFFTMLKTGSVIFEKNSYDTLCSLPISERSIVISRFFRMYIGDLGLSLAVMLPGLAVYAFLLHPGIGFYLTSIVGTLFIPMLPLSVATLFGAIITAISSRMKHKSIVSAVLSTIFVVGIMYGSSRLNMINTENASEILNNMTTVITNLLGKMYLPAIWFGSAVNGDNVIMILVFAAVSIAVFAAIIFVISVKFNSICRSLYSVNAKHNYQLSRLTSNSVLKSLYMREFKHYTSCSVYLLNTTIGPILALAFAIALLVVGFDTFNFIIPFKINLNCLIPVAFSTIMCLMTTTCTSISMEGKDWWIAKSLPIRTKDLMDSKILVNLSLYAPVYVVSEILFYIALKPDLKELIWLIVSPVIYSLFACVFGIFMNIKLPIFDWENEVTVVKQSASSAIGGLGGGFVIILSAIPIVLLNDTLPNIIEAVVALIIFAATVILYRESIKIDLKKLG